MLFRLTVNTHMARNFQNSRFAATTWAEGCPGLSLAAPRLWHHATTSKAARGIKRMLNNPARCCMHSKD